MASILFVDYQTIIPASWLNDVNNLVYGGTLPSTSLTVQNLTVTTSLNGTGVTAKFASPPPIGSSSANTGAFTTLSASGVVSGVGFSNYMAAPPAIGGSSANAGSFTNLSSSGTVSGTGFSTYLASPPAIGGTSAGAGTFTTLGATTGNITTVNATAVNATGQVNFSSTGAMLIPRGTTAQRPAINASGFRFNTDTLQFEGYNGSSWSSVGGATITNDITTSGNRYPLFAAATSGFAQAVYTSNAKYLYNPNTGTLTSTTFSASSGLMLNAATVSADFTVPTGYNAQSAGPITINTGVIVTVSDTSCWVIN